MKFSTFLAASSLALSVFAAPIHERAELRVVYGTFTTEIIEYVWTTTTVVEGEATSTSKATPVAAFYEASAAAASSSTTSVAQAAPTTVAAVASPTPVAPTTTSTPAPIATSAAQVAPTPVVAAVVAPTAAVASSVASAVSSPVVATTSAVSTPAASASSASSGAYPYTGDITYYDVEVGLGSCGQSGSNSQDLVAIGASVMANGANPNANPKCGKQIEISYQGNTHTATVFDTCPSCVGGSIDLTEELFKKVAPNGDGRVSGVSWRFVN